VAKQLTSSTQFYCEFGDGGSSIADGASRMAGGAHFSGGPMTFLVLDLPSGKAQMSGSAGASGSIAGTSAMRVTATDNSMSFSGFTPLGYLIVTTIFATRTGSGGYAAVRSTHGLREPHVVDQFSGSCVGDAQEESQQRQQ